MRIIAHRGFSAKAPENTLAAFEAALAIGADGIECDVQLSRDGELVICHDETLDRTTNGHGFLKDYDWAELQKLDAGSWFGPEFRGERLPSLAELLDLIQGTDLLVNIELKTTVFPYPGLEEKVIDLLRRFELADQALLSSFNPLSVMKVKELEPSLLTGILFVVPTVVPDVWAAVKELQVDALHPFHESVTPEMLAGAHERGLLVNAWTVDEPEDVRELLLAGVDGVITNCPDVAKSVIQGS